MQQNRPIAFYNKALSERSSQKSTYEKELMALVHAVLHWRSYLLGRKFVVRTDHRSLRHILHQQISSPSQQYWVAKLMGYDFDVEYKAGPTNTAADSLTRRDAESELTAITLPKWIEWDNLREEVANDLVYSPIVHALQKGEEVKRPFTLVHGFLYYKDRLAVPATSSWVARFISEFHSTPMREHAGALRTYK